VPLDSETIVASVKRTNRLLICHEAPERGGWAGEIAMTVVEKDFDHLDAPIARVCGRNLPIPYSSTLEDAAIPSEEELMSAARRLLKW
jgi:pyruvate/2-oxoglutarate/acetoin dehydrogenase E1 component